MTRPYMPPEPPRGDYVTLTIRFPKPDHERLRFLSFTRRRHMSVLLRDAITQYLDRQNIQWPQGEAGEAEDTSTAKTAPSS